MNGQKNYKQLITLIVIPLLLVGCRTPQAAEPTRSQPTEEPTPAPPTPTATLIPPTPTPTATLIPPTPTPLTPDFYGDTNFPIGVFIGHNPPAKLTLRAEGSWEWGYPTGGALNKGLFGINGDLISIMTFTSSSGSQTPVTYFWEFDGVQLTFSVNGEDLREERVEQIKNNTLFYEGPSFLGTEAKDHTFPFGRFVNADSTRAFEFDEDGLWRFYEGDMENPARLGKYVTNGDVYTEMTHVNPHEQQVPVTYIWTFDGENLTFELWGEDVIPYRESIYNGQTYIWAED